MAPGAPQTAAANQARRERTQEKLRDIAGAISQLQRRRLPVSYPAIAARAGVSRTFLYDNPDARGLVTAAISRAGSPAAQRPSQPRRPGRSVLAAAGTERRAGAQGRARRDPRPARPHRRPARPGPRRPPGDGDTAGRLADDNSTLRQRIRDLTAQQRTLEERLQAARSNNRFLDKRIAGLEAQLLDQAQG